MFRRTLLGSLFLFMVAITLTAQVDSGLYGAMRWRHIGPFRGGRTVAATGIRQQPNVFYIGVNNGGVWRSTDYGRIWMPVFDDQPTGSIGALAVAPSDPNVVYVGSGEGLQRPDLSTGDGIYRSSDAGKTWQHFGLRDGQQIPAIAVDPKDPNRLFVAVLGHPYGPNSERGIFRSTDGGRNFERVLYRDENTGGMDVILDPANSQIVYAALWAARQGPWENAAFSGKTSGLFKSTDGGTTWKELVKGLPRPADGLGRIGLDVSQSDSRRIFAIVDAKTSGGVYGSSDGGESWQLINADDRLWGRGGDFNEVRIDPKNPDVLYVANVVTWKSTDGGKTFAAFRGAPGGDDYHRLWINPDNTSIILNASDQGAIITVNGGETWSSWYNQPTAQMFHVSTDNAFPYRVCGGQQESGSACVASRGDDGEITFRDWHPVGAEEYGYAVPDPLDPDLIYGGKLSRYDRRTKQVQEIGPRPLRGDGYRVIRTAPVVFSPVDPHILYFGSNTLWKTSNGGNSWTEISPDLSRREWSVPSSVGIYTSLPSAAPKQRGVIYAVAPSPLDVNRIWAGTDDGLIHVTADGGATWKNVTATQLQPWMKISVLEASHFDASTAYAAVNTLRLDDLRPHIYRTRDGGATWTHVTNGISDGGTVNVIREDPKRKGLLYAGTEREVYVSFDDGDHWQSLRRNMPATSIRDLVIKDDDVVVATHGRGFWILDNVEPLRQFDRAGSAASKLFAPAVAMRVRWNTNTDTPLPPDEPAGQNPPDGAMIDYYLAGKAANATLDILDGSGAVIRSYSSAFKATPVADSGNVPRYWIRPQQELSTAPGMHRFLWDLHVTPLPGSKPQYPIAAIAHDTAPSPTSPWVMPGVYSVRLTVDGHSETQPLTVKMDPRVHTDPSDLARQYSLSRQVYDELVATDAAITSLHEMRPAKPAAGNKGSTPAVTTERERAAAALEGEESDEPRAANQPETLRTLSRSLSVLLDLLQEADVAPSTQLVATVDARHAVYNDLMKRVEVFRAAKR
jgi:photosystem II stability/assembly factor-like uncharacterized protein